MIFLEEVNDSSQNRFLYHRFFSLEQPLVNLKQIDIQSSCGSSSAGHDHRNDTSVIVCSVSPNIKYWGGTVTKPHLNYQSKYCPAHTSYWTQYTPTLCLAASLLTWAREELSSVEYRNIKHGRVFSCAQACIYFIFDQKYIKTLLQFKIAVFYENLWLISETKAVFSIITAVFSVTWSSEIIIICCLRNIYDYYQCWKHLICCFFRIHRWI